MSFKEIVPEKNIGIYYISQRVAELAQKFGNIDGAETALRTIARVVYRSGQWPTSPEQAVVAAFQDVRASALIR